MGADIHLYVEYNPREKEKRYIYNEWQNLGHRFNPGRDYNLFALLADVRSNREGIALFPPRGFPKDAGSYTKRDNHLFIVDNEDEDHDSTTCTRYKAEQWVIQGISKFVDDSGRWVTQPDWHSHSWLTCNEFEKVLKTAEDASVEYFAILAAMKELEKNGNDTRVVFWFDN